MITAGKKFANKEDLRRAVINASNYHGVAVRVRTIRSEKQRISFGCHSVTRRGNRKAEGECKFIVNAKYVQADGDEPACWQIKDGFVLGHEGTCINNAETYERVQQLVFSTRDMALHVADYMKVHGSAPRIKHLMKHLDSVLKLPPGTIKDHHARRAVETAHTFVYGKAEDSYGVLFEWILTNRRADNDFVGLLEYALVPIEVYDPATMSMHASYEQSITSKMLSLPIPADKGLAPSNRTCRLLHPMAMAAKRAPAAAATPAAVATAATPTVVAAAAAAAAVGMAAAVSLMNFCLHATQEHGLLVSGRRRTKGAKSQLGRHLPLRRPPCSSTT